MDYYMKSPSSVAYSYSPPVSPNTRLLGDAEKKLLELNHQQDLQNIKLGNVTLNLDWAVENTSTFHKDTATLAKVNLYDTLWNLSSHDYTIKHWIKNYPNCIVEMIKTADKNMKLVVKRGILEEKSYEYSLALSSMGILSNILSIKKGLKFFMKRVAYVEHFFGLLVWTMFNLDYLHADDLKKEILRFIYFGTFNAKVANIYRYNENFYRVLKFCLQPSNTGDILETTLLIIQNLLKSTSDSMHSLYVVERLPARELKFLAVNGDYSLREMSESILKKAENIYHTHTYDSEQIVKDFVYDTPVHQKRDHQKFTLSDKKREHDHWVSSTSVHDYKRRRCESLEVNVSSSDIIPCKKSKMRHEHRRKTERRDAGDKFESSDISHKKEKHQRYNKHARKSHKVSLENRHVSCHLMEIQMKQQREEIISKEVLLKDVSNILDSIMKINSELITEIGTLKNEIKETIVNKFRDEVITNVDYLENETSPSFISDKDLPSPSNFSKDTQSSIGENVGILDSDKQSLNSAVSPQKKSLLIENTQSSMLKLIEINKRLIKQVGSLRDRFRPSKALVSSGNDNTSSILKKSFEQIDFSKSSYFGTITFNNKFFANSSHSIQTENMNFVKTVSTSPSASIRAFSPLTDSLAIIPKSPRKSIGQKICDVINKTTNKIVDITNTQLSDDFIDKLYDEIKSDVANNVMSPTQLSEILDISLDISHGDVSKKAVKNTLKSGIKKKKTTIWTKYLKYLKSKVLNILYINISYAMQKSSCLIHPYVLTRRDTLPMIKNLKSCKKQNYLTRRCYLKKSKSRKSIVSSSCGYINAKSSGSFYVSGNFCDMAKKISSLSFSKSSSQSGQLKCSSAPTFEFCSSIRDKAIKGSSHSSKLPLLKKSDSGKKSVDTVDESTTINNDKKKHDKRISNKKRTHKIIISTSVAQTDIKIAPK